jgi:hypothetical protein
MPLNIEVEAEHPDVTALKKNVAQVAKRYATAHGWCSVVDDALREAGVTGPSGPRNINVEVTFTINGGEEQKATHRFPREPFVGKSAEQQHQYVLDQIVTPVSVLGVEVRPDVQIVDLNETTGLGRDGLDYPDGYIHVYSSREGRVAHLLRLPVNEPENLGRWIRRGLHYAMCGSLMSTPTQESDRSEDRVCKKCLDRAATAVAS